jgi:hypothetical protein
MERRIPMERQAETHLQRVKLFPRQVEEREQAPEDSAHAIHEGTRDELARWNRL